MTEETTCIKDTSAGTCPNCGAGTQLIYAIPSKKCRAVSRVLLLPPDKLSWLAISITEVCSDGCGYRSPRR